MYLHFSWATTIGRGGRDERGCRARCARQAARVRHRGGGWPAGTARIQEDAHFAENGRQVPKRHIMLPVIAKVECVLYASLY